MNLADLPCIVMATQDDDHVPVDEAGPSGGAGPSDADAAGPSGLKAAEQPGEPTVAANGDSGEAGAEPVCCSSALLFVSIACVHLPF